MEKGWAGVAAEGKAAVGRVVEAMEVGAPAGTGKAAYWDREVERLVPQKVCMAA